MNPDNPSHKSPTPLAEENNEKDFSELNQAISNVIENQLDDQESEANSQEQEQEDQSSARYISHFFREKPPMQKEQMFYSPDMRKTDCSRVNLSPPVPYMKYGTPNLNQRQMWPVPVPNVNMNTFQSVKPTYMGMNPMGFSPIHSYQYGTLYGNFNNYFPNPNVYNPNYMLMGGKPNEEMQMPKASNKQGSKNKNKAKNKGKNGKAYISQSPNLKSLFGNGKNGQCIKFVPNYVSNPLRGEEQNQISLDSIITDKDKRTTLMIKNIPNKYTISTFLEEINADFNSKYDIFYLPIDYGNKCNLGFAFINFVEPLHIIDFYETYRGKKWKRFNSEKICDLVYAKIQGKKELIAHFEKGKVLLFESEDKRPLILQTPSPLPPVTIPSKLLNSFMMAYPFALYHSVSEDKVVIDSLFSF